MLPKRYRLKKNIEFVATYAQKKYISNMYLTLNLGKQKPFEDYISKVAFVVSKKIDKRAVVRNKIKRRMREAYKEILNENINIKWISLIFSAKKDCINADYQTIKKQLLYILEKASNKYDITIYYTDIDDFTDIEYEEFKSKFSFDGGTPITIFFKEGKEKTTATRIEGNISYEKIIDKLKKNGFINE